MTAILIDFIRFLFLQPLQGDPKKNWSAYLGVGFAITWLVGFGRTWDFDAAPLWLRSGFTSILYTFVLAALIWSVTLALKPARWSYRNVLLMVTMTAAPGLVYGIPVERFMPPEAARGVNMLLLLIVATWRMVLYYHFLRTVSSLPRGAALVAWLLPPTLIVAPLSLLGLLNAIAQNMGGVREQVDPGEISGEAIFFVAAASWIALPVLSLAFIVLAIRRNRRAPNP